MMTSRSHTGIPPVSNKTRGLQITGMLIKNKIFFENVKLRHFGKITAFTAFDENHGFRDFRVSVIIYCPYVRLGSSNWRRVYL